ASNVVIELFESLSTSIDRIIEKQSKAQLRRKVEHLRQSLEILRNSREDTIRKYLYLQVTDEQKLRNDYSDSLSKFRQLMDTTRNEFRTFSAELGEWGEQGEAVTKMLGVEFGNPNASPGSTIYGGGATSLDDIVRESKLCSAKLNEAIRSVDNFLELLQ